MIANAQGITSALYTAEQRRRRNESPWTVVQGVLAVTQFVAFLISLAIVTNFLITGTGYALATASIVVKTCILFIIMITGSIWEKVVFDQYLFAPAFFWEDVVSMAVIALHAAYVICLLLQNLSQQNLIYLALTAYAIYVVNALQFLLKLRQARLQPVTNVTPHNFAASEGAASL